MQTPARADPENTPCHAATASQPSSKNQPEDFESQLATKRKLFSSQAENALTELRRDDSQPLWRQLAGRLRAGIAAGTLSPNARLPVEQELGRVYDISRITVRQAMQQLLNEGLVDRKQGKGTFVADHVVRHDLAELTGIIDQMRAQGLSPQTSLISFAADSDPVLKVMKRVAVCGLGERRDEA